MMRSMEKDKGTVWGYSGEVYCMGIQWRRVNYGDAVEKGTVWGYSGEVWEYSGEG